MDKANESYYSYYKSLYLLLSALPLEPAENCTSFLPIVDTLLYKLATYELPISLKLKLLAYYEHIERYGKAEDTLYEMLEDSPGDHTLIEQGQQFYTRLLQKSSAALQAGNFSREEATEGLRNLQQEKR
jgi:hypothetical protein